MADRFRPSPDTATVAGAGPEGPVHYLARMPGGRILVLSGSAADIWDRVCELGDIEAVVLAVAEDFEQPVEVVGPSVRAFVAELTELGLLEADPAR